MSERGPGDEPVPDDPFLAEDPAAREREARRREREARRAQREAKRASQGSGATPRSAEPSGPSAAERASAALSGLGERISRRRAERQAPPPPVPEEPDPAGTEQFDIDTAEPGPVFDDEPDYADEPAHDEIAAEPAPAAEPPPAEEPPAEEPPRDRSEPIRYSKATPPPGRGGGGFLSRLPRPSPVWIVAIVFLVAVLLFANALFQPFHGEAGEKVLFKIPKGASAGEVADDLDQKGIVSSGTLLEIRLTLAGRRSDLFAGTYSLQEGMSYSDVITELTKPPSERTIAVSVPEGYGREQIAKLATDSGLEGSYEKASKSSKELDPADYGAEGASSLEGFLYPSTYELKAKSTSEDLVEEQLAAFKQDFKKVDLSHAKSKNLSAYDILIIASMIDREVMVAKERDLVSSVIYNRLEDGTPLGIDATIRYATGNYDKPLLQSELELDSPYNTRENTGLPPTPIGNPGIAAIEAAANPADTDYRYYVVKPGTCGEHEFSETDAEAAAATERYNEAREAAGGKSPTDC